MCQGNSPCSLLSAQFSLSVSLSLSNKDTILTITLFFVHPAQGNDYSGGECSSHTSLCCMCPYETKLRQLGDFNHLSIASWHTMEIFNKKNQLAAGWCSTASAVSTRRAHHKQVGDFSSTAATRNLRALWAVGTNWTINIELGRGQLGGLEIFCTLVIDAVILPVSLNEITIGKPQGRLSASPLLGSMPYFAQRFRGGRSIVMQCQRPLGLKIVVCVVLEVQRKSIDPTRWDLFR